MDKDELSDAAVALAALSMCESLIVSLVEKGVLDASDYEEIVESARESHLNAVPHAFSHRIHRRAADILARILTKSNSIRGAAHL